MTNFNFDTLTVCNRFVKQKYIICCSGSTERLNTDRPNRLGIGLMRRFSPRLKDDGSTIRLDLFTVLSISPNRGWIECLLLLWASPWRIG